MAPGEGQHFCCPLCGTFFSPVAALWPPLPAGAGSAEGAGARSERRLRGLVCAGRGGGTADPSGDPSTLPWGPAARLLLTLPGGWLPAPRPWGRPGPGSGRWAWDGRSPCISSKPFSHFLCLSTKSPPTSRPHERSTAPPPQVTTTCLLSRSSPELSFEVLPTAVTKGHQITQTQRTAPAFAVSFLSKLAHYFTECPTEGTAGLLPVTFRDRWSAVQRKPQVSALPRTSHLTPG